MQNTAPESAGRSLATQTQFWDDWNLGTLANAHRTWLQLQQRDWVRSVATRVAAASGGRPLRILDFGCGTGWLGASLTEFGDVTGIDLSPAAIEHGKREFPDVRLLAGSFSDVSLEGPFDLVISSEVIAHVGDQEAYVRRVAELLRPGGTFLLISQNGFVWRRWSQLVPQHDGQLRNWPRLRDLRAMLAVGGFATVRVGSMQPSGDRGILRVLNSRILRGGFKLLRLGGLWQATLERMLLGRDFAIEARRP